MLKSYKLTRSIRNRGIYGTFLTILNRYIFRFRFRELDLWGNVDPPDMEGPDHVKEHAARYEPTNPLYFRKVFDKLDWNYHNSVFVDFGCGKGASMVYASGMNFKKIIGVEFCKNLSGIAHKNLAKHAHRSVRYPDYEVVNSDAAEYDIPAEADCFYFFNPFDAVILDKVMKNIFRSLHNRNRKILIVYLNAIHWEIIEKYPVRLIKSLPPDELDVYFPGGACVYLFDEPVPVAKRQFSHSKAMAV
ncbi:MAG: class I SAM-dependent methyltransferase [Syntrophothermus sp.]